MFSFRKKKKPAIVKPYVTRFDFKTYHVGYVTEIFNYQNLFSMRLGSDYDSP